MKINQWKEIYHEYSKHKKTGETLLILGKITFKSGSILTDKERHFLMRRGSVNQEDIIIINVYAPNKRDSNYTLDTQSMKSFQNGESIDVLGGCCGLTPWGEGMEPPYPGSFQTLYLFHLAVPELYAL